MLRAAPQPVGRRLPDVLAPHLARFHVSRHYGIIVNQKVKLSDNYFCFLLILEVV